jgi:hypothetical protein
MFNDGVIGNGDYTKAVILARKRAGGGEGLGHIALLEDLIAMSTTETSEWA